MRISFAGGQAEKELKKVKTRWFNTLTEISILLDVDNKDTLGYLCFHEQAQNLEKFSMAEMITAHSNLNFENQDYKNISAIFHNLSAEKPQ
jgi:hypothetical protein